MRYFLCPRKPFSALETNFGHFCRFVFAPVEWIIAIRRMTVPGCCENTYLEYASTRTTISFKVIDISCIICNVCCALPRIRSTIDLESSVVLLRIQLDSGSQESRKIKPQSNYWIVSRE